MTDEMMNLRLLVERRADSDLLREMIGDHAVRWAIAMSAPGGSG